MKRSLIAMAAAVAFSLGLFVSPAFAAGSHPGTFAVVFGNSTSCALGRASTNDATERGGALTNNYAGCSSSNSYRSVPPYYLGSKAYVVSSYDGTVCGESSTYWNTSTTYTRDASTPREYYNPSCENPGYYNGVSNNYRQSDAGSIYGLRRVANGYYFQSYLI